MSIATLAASGGIGFLPIIIVLFLVMWLFMIRPQRKKQMQQQELLRNVQPGDEIVTAGGLIGTIVSTADDELTLEVAPGVTVRVARRAVAAVMRDDEPAEEALDEAEDGYDEEPAEVEAGDRRS